MSEQTEPLVTRQVTITAAHVAAHKAIRQESDAEPCCSCPVWQALADMVVDPYHMAVGRFDVRLFNQKTRIDDLSGPSFDLPVELRHAIRTYDNTGDFPLGTYPIAAPASFWRDGEGVTP